jgi:hypothetical protein
MNKIEDIQIGQIWRDKDKRRQGRQLKVEKIEDGYALCSSRQGADGIFGNKLNRISLSRFDRYALMEQGTEINQGQSLAVAEVEQASGAV